MRIWGYWATLGWAFLAFMAGQFGALAIILLLHVGNINAVLASPFDGSMVTLFILISNPITIAVIALAVWIARARQAEYLALKLPAAGDVWDRADLPGRIDRNQRRAALFGWISAGYAVSGPSLHDRRRRRLVAGAFAWRRHCRASGRGDLVSRIFVPRVGSVEPHCMACDRGDLDFMGGVACPVRLDRNFADFRRRVVRRLDALAQRFDAADILAARAVQSGSFGGNRAADPLFLVA